jgi:hypothetical protein
VTVAQTVGAPLRTVTVRDTIGDLPPVENGADREEMPYGGARAWHRACPHPCSPQRKSSACSGHVSSEHACADFTTLGTEAWVHRLRLHSDGLLRGLGAALPTRLLSSAATS